MNIDTLKYFCVLGESASFTQAAQYFYISQQGLNKAVTSLESELGCQLVKRGNKGISLTDDGRIFLEGAKRILADYSAIVDSLSSHSKDISNISSGSIRVAATPVCMLSLVGPLAKLGQTAHLHASEISYDEAMDHVLDSNSCVLYDLASFLNDDPIRINIGKTVDILPIVRTVIGIAVPKGMLPSVKSAVSPSDIVSLPIAMFDNKTTRRMYDAIFKNSPLQNTVLRSTNVDYLAGSAARGDCALLIDSFQWRQMIERDPETYNLLTFYQIEGHFESIFGFVFPIAMPDDDKRRTFMESFKRVFLHECIQMPI